MIDREHKTPADFGLMVNDFPLPFAHPFEALSRDGAFRRFPIENPISGK